MIKIKNEIIQGDCIQKIKEIPNNSVDFILTDPPYGIGNQDYVTKKGNKSSSNKEAWGSWDSKEDGELILKIMPELQRILHPKGNMAIFYDQYELMKIYQKGRELDLHPNNIFVLVKDNPVPHFQKNGFRSGVETAALFRQDKQSTFNFLSQEKMKNWMHYSTGDYETKHPTEKPLTALRRLINIYSDQDDTVFDPFFGSGSSLVAAKQLNRRYIGIEKKKEYVDMARERLSAQPKNLKQFSKQSSL